MRNIIQIMLDLSDKRSTNFYPGNSKNPCHPQKNTARKLNKTFEPRDEICQSFLQNLSDTRKALSHHLDVARHPLYGDDMSVMEFVEKCLHVGRKGYCKTLRVQIEEKILAKRADTRSNVIAEESDLVWPAPAHWTEVEALDSMERERNKTKTPKNQAVEYNKSPQTGRKPEITKESELAEAKSPERKKGKKPDDRNLSPRGGLK